ncbi:hypothetical protein TNCV_1956661 [Trichonephila clavipes]|nr:hypothetical protein TNCV_1956661 [Trichonephila clavipes]
MLLPEVESLGSWRKAAVWLQSSELLTASFHDFGDNFKLQEQPFVGSVVVVHEEPHPQMTGTLSYRPEETGGRQREKSLDTRHRRLCGAGKTGNGETVNGDEYSLQMRADSV